MKRNLKIWAILGLAILAGIIVGFAGGQEQKQRIQIIRVRSNQLEIQDTKGENILIISGLPVSSNGKWFDMPDTADGVKIILKTKDEKKWEANWIEKD